MCIKNNTQTRHLLRPPCQERISPTQPKFFFFELRRPVAPPVRSPARLVLLCFTVVLRVASASDAFRARHLLGLCDKQPGCLWLMACWKRNSPASKTDQAGNFPRVVKEHAMVQKLIGDPQTSHSQTRAQHFNMLSSIVQGSQEGQNTYWIVQINSRRESSDGHSQTRYASVVEDDKSGFNVPSGLSSTGNLRMRHQYLLGPRHSSPRELLLAGLCHGFSLPPSLGRTHALSFR